MIGLKEAKSNFEKSNSAQAQNGSKFSVVTNNNNSKFTLSNEQVSSINNGVPRSTFSAAKTPFRTCIAVVAPATKDNNERNVDDNNNNKSNMVEKELESEPNKLVDDSKATIVIDCDKPDGQAELEPQPRPSDVVNPRKTTPRNVHFSPAPQPSSQSSHSMATELSSGTKKAKLTEVGLINLPKQVYRRSVQKGFEFNLMVVGESGLGKSTLINSMFMANIYDDEHVGPSQRIQKTLQVERSAVMLKEGEVRLMLSVVDTPGFGDSLDNSDCWESIVSYIEHQFDAFLVSEMRFDRIKRADQRVHCCLYFIAPNGHGLRKIDLEFMRNLHDKVNIIPVIGKSDTLTPEELLRFKEIIRSQIKENEIQIYQSEEHKAPFAVVGSNCVIENSNGQRVRGRKYPWGVVNIEDSAHCDFVALRRLLISSDLNALYSLTHSLHYEHYRQSRLSDFAGPELTEMSLCPLAQMELEQREHELKLKKMQREMEEVFSRKVEEKLRAMEKSRKEMDSKREEQKERLRDQRRDLDMRRTIFEQEVLEWERQNNMQVEQLIRFTNLQDQESSKDKKKRGAATLSGVSFKLGR